MLRQCIILPVVLHPAASPPFIICPGAKILTAIFLSLSFFLFFLLKHHFTIGGQFEYKQPNEKFAAKAQKQGALLLFSWPSLRRFRRNPAEKSCCKRSVRALLPVFCFDTKSGSVTLNCVESMKCLGFCEGNTFRKTHYLLRGDTFNKKAPQRCAFPPLTVLLLYLSSFSVVHLKAC